MSMWGYVKYPQGRPRKESRQSHFTNFFVPKKSSTTAPKPKSQGKVEIRATYGQYDQPGVMKDAMDIGVASMLASGGNSKLAYSAIIKGCGEDVVIPRQTLLSRFKSAKARLEVGGETPGGIFERKQRKQSRSLTDQSTRDLLQSVAKSRDHSNNGMSRKEMINFISEIEGVSLKTSENHYDYLIRSKQLPELKGHGRVVSAQATTTNRTAITTQKLLRTHNTMEMGEYMIV